MVRSSPKLSVQQAGICSGKLGIREGGSRVVEPSRAELLRILESERARNRALEDNLQGLRAHILNIQDSLDRVEVRLNDIEQSFKDHITRARLEEHQSDHESKDK